MSDYGRMIDLSAQKEYQELLNLCEEILRKDENLAPVWYNKGNALSDLGRHGEALAAFERCLRLDENLAPALVHRHP